MRLIDADYVTEELNEINGTAELEKAFEVVENAPTADVLDKIRAEVQHEADNTAYAPEMKAYYRCLQIIDKYR